MIIIKLNVFSGCREDLLCRCELLLRMLIYVLFDHQVLLGDVGTGKSSLVLRFVKGQFVEFQVTALPCSLHTPDSHLNYCQY